MNAYSKWWTTFLNLQGTKSYPSTPFSFSITLLSYIRIISLELQQINFFFLFLSLSHPDLAKNNAEKRFFNFLNFWLFFARVEYERNSGLNFFSHFLSLSHPVLAKNTVGNWFFNFLNFFFYFFRNFLARVEYERNSGIKFFSSLSPPISSRSG